MNHLRDFWRRLHRFHQVFFIPDDFNGPLGPFLEILKSSQLIQASGIIANIDCDCGEKEVISYLSRDEDRTKGIGFYHCSTNPSGRIWLSEEQVQRWQLNLGAFLASLAEKWDLEGDLVSLDDNSSWLLGRYRGVNIVVSYNPVSEILQRIDNCLIFVFDKDQLQPELPNELLGQYVTLDEESGDILVARLDDKVESLIRVHDISQDDSILLDDPTDCRLYPDQKTIAYRIPSDPNPLKVELSIGQSELLQFYFHQSRSNRQLRYFNNDIARQNCPHFQDKKPKTLENNKSQLSTLHSHHKGLPRLLQDDGNHGTRLNDNLSCMKNERIKASRKAFPKASGKR